MQHYTFVTKIRSITQHPQQLLAGRNKVEAVYCGWMFSISFHLKRAEGEEEEQGTLKRIQKLVGGKKGTQSSSEESKNSTDTRGEKPHGNGLCTLLSGIDLFFHL